MKASKLVLFLLVILLASCNGFASTPTTSPEMGTAIAKAQTAYVETQTAIPENVSPPQTLTMQALLTPTDISNALSIFAPGTPRPNQQIYTDPDGWYLLYLPIDMKPSSSMASTFTRLDGALETGYLTDMGHMSNFMNVCFWLANTAAGSEQNLIDSYPYPNPDRCSVSTMAKSDGSEMERTTVFENSAADPNHRFVFVKTRKLSVGADNIRYTFFWRKPTTPEKNEQLASISDEEISLWRKTAPILQGVTVTEYNLPPGSDPNHDAWASKELPKEALPDFSNHPKPIKTPTMEEQLKPLGYEFKIINEVNPYRRLLLRDGRVLFDYIFDVSDIYNFSTDSGSITAFIVTTATIDWRGPRNFKSFLIQNDAIYAWEYNHQDPPFKPILYQDELLWLKTTKDFNHIQILKTNQDVVYSFAAYTEPIYSVNQFLAWDGHWTLAAHDFLIQDGAMLNQKLGFEEIFNWSLVDNKPVYLFRKGSRIGFSFDGKILPLEYQDVARYLCCGYAANNPITDDNSTHFYGKRNGVWYYVVIEFQ